MLTERRRKRSQDPLIALHYHLAEVRAEVAFDAVVVADSSGLVLAGAGSWAVCEELAGLDGSNSRWTGPRTRGMRDMLALAG